MSSRCTAAGARQVAIVRSVALWIAAALGVASILLATACALFQLRTEVVISGSMEPAIPVGSLLLASPTPAGEVHPGKVVTVERPHGRGLVSHRVVVVRAVTGGAELTLKGDANRTTADPEPYRAATAGHVVASIPFAGYVAVAITTPAGIASAHLEHNSCARRLGNVGAAGGAGAIAYEAERSRGEQKR